VTSLSKVSTKLPEERESMSFAPQFPALKTSCWRLAGYILWLASFSVVASPIEDGLQAFRSGDEVRAEKLWRAPAENNRFLAQFFLSVLYGNGKGELEDQVLSMQWLRRAADAGFAPAQFNLGNHYFQGRWIEQSHQQARFWWQLAAEQGWEGAQYNLGNIYYRGIGVVKNREQAEYWLKRAAATGSKPAKEILRRLQVSGVGSAIDGTVKSDLLTIDTEWVRSQPEQNRTIQLMATVDLSLCPTESIKMQRRFGIKVAIFHYKSKGSTYCALLTGSYVDAAQARTALTHLPEMLRKRKPWLRSFRSLRNRAP